MYIDNENFEKWMAKLSTKLTEIGQDLKSLINTDTIFDENDKIVVMINSSDEVREADIPVWRMGIIQETRMARLMLSDREGYSDEAKVYPVVNGLIHIECPPMSGMIIKDIESMG